jgi:hypothetical protein
MGSIMLMAIATTIGISVAAIVVSHASIVGVSVETASSNVSKKVNELKHEISYELRLLRKELGDV